ncbi:unnamed protein product [Rhizophagus irregularis]|nr:unnamed protein product [Rhizophagus irregularis]
MSHGQCRRILLVQILCPDFVARKICKFIHLFLSNNRNVTYVPSFFSRTDFLECRLRVGLRNWMNLEYFIDLVWTSKSKKKDGPWILYRSQILYRPGLQNKKEIRTLDIISAWTSNKKEFFLGWTSQNVDNGSDFEIIILGFQIG